MSGLSEDVYVNKKAEVYNLSRRRDLCCVSLFKGSKTLSVLTQQQKIVRLPDLRHFLLSTKHAFIEHTLLMTLWFTDCFRMKQDKIPTFHKKGFQPLDVQYCLKLGKSSKVTACLTLMYLPKFWFYSYKKSFLLSDY